MKHTKNKEETVMMVQSTVGTGSRTDFSRLSDHLHRHSFYVTHMGYGCYQNGMLAANTLCSVRPPLLSQTELVWWNGTQPDFSKYSTTGKIDRMAIHKDTVIVPAGG